MFFLLLELFYFWLLTNVVDKKDDDEKDGEEKDESEVASESKKVQTHVKCYKISILQ